MAYLFKSYCYETVAEVANAVHSSFLLPFGVIQSVDANGSNLSVSYLYQSSSGLVSSSFIYPLATCEKLGFDNSFSGLTQIDSVAIGSAVVSVLIAAWSIKIIKRML
jgi:hypothetical protein